MELVQSLLHEVYAHVPRLVDIQRYEITGSKLSLEAANEGSFRPYVITI